jgi:hypothetical protein
MSSSGILRFVAVVRTDVSEERTASIIRVTRIGEVGTTLALTATCFGCKLLLMLFPARRFLSPWWWRQSFPSKRRFLQEPHGLTFQNTTFFKRYISWRMPSSGMLRRVDIERTDVSEGRIAYIVYITRIDALWTTLAVTGNDMYLSVVRFVCCLLLTFFIAPNLVTLMIDAIISTETSVLTTATRRNIPEDDILHSYRPETSNLLYTFLNKHYLLNNKYNIN